MEHKKRIKLIEKLWKDRYKGFDRIFHFEKYLTDDKKHLDFGCGFGAFVHILAEKFPKTMIYGQDIDMNEIDIGKELYKDKNINFICSEIIDGNYDSISVFFTFSDFSGDVQESIKNLYKSLNPGGNIFVYDYRKVTKEEFIKFYKNELIHQISSFKKEFEEHNLWKEKDFRKIMENAGFKTILSKSYKKYWFYYMGEK